MAPRAAITAGSPADAFAASQLTGTEDLRHLCPDIPAALPIVAFVLTRGLPVSNLPFRTSSNKLLTVI
jgi:hypothetical protein